MRAGDELDQKVPLQNEKNDEDDEEEWDEVRKRKKTWRYEMLVNLVGRLSRSLLRNSLLLSVNVKPNKLIQTVI